MTVFDVAIIGGGLIGTSAAAYLAEAGRSVVLFEQAAIASGASGRNSGVVQHPFDPPLAQLHHDSVALFRELTVEPGALTLPARPAGVLLISFDEEAVSSAAAAIRGSAPELQPTVLSSAALQKLEPLLASGLAACRLETGYPIAPATATWTFSRRAERAAAVIRTGMHAEPVVSGGRAVGVRLGPHEIVPCGQILVAAGPSTPALIGEWSADPPIWPVWGVIAATTLVAPPGHVLEELGIVGAVGLPERMFSLVTAAGSSSVGSTFLRDEPDALELAAEVLVRAAEFVPVLRDAPIDSVRACARPVSFDGRPIIGAIPGTDGLFVCAGHGPWGISTGPASALLVVRQMLGVGLEWPEFSPQRVAPGGI